MSDIAEKIVNQVNNFDLAENATITDDTGNRLIIHITNMYKKFQYSHLMKLQQIVDPNATCVDSVSVYGCGNKDYNIFITI